MTGHYPSKHGVWNNVCNEQALSTGLKKGIRCWSEDLRDSGYDLHFFGKWHVSAQENPADRGWTEHHVTARSDAYMGMKYPGYRALPDTDATATRVPGEVKVPGYPHSVLYSLRESALPTDDMRIVYQAVDTLHTMAANAKPWCFYVGTFGPHDPYEVPQEYLDMYRDVEVPLPESFSDSMEDKPRIYQRIRQLYANWSEDEYRQARRHYWAYCTWMDALFGKLLETLEATGQADNTLVIYCSDHGDYCGDHGLFCKGIPAFRSAYHVPAFIRWPERLQRAGQREDALVSLADFAPTILEAAGLSPDKSIAGQSLIPFLDNNDSASFSWRDCIHTQSNGVELYYTQRAVWTSEWKYVFNGFDFDELYDLKNDPNEMHNLAEDPAYDAIKHVLIRKHWLFAESHADGAHNDYFTVRLFPEGPAGALR